MKELDLLFKYCGSGQAMSSKIQNALCMRSDPCAENEKLLSSPSEKPAHRKEKMYLIRSLLSCLRNRALVPTELEILASTGRWQERIFLLLFIVSQFKQVCCSHHVGHHDYHKTCSSRPDSQKSCRRQLRLMSEEVINTDDSRRVELRCWLAMTVEGLLARDELSSRWRWCPHRDVAFVEHSSAASPSASSSGSRNIHQHITGISFTILTETFLNIWLLLITRGENIFLKLFPIRSYLCFSSVCNYSLRHVKMFVLLLICYLFFSFYSFPLFFSSHTLLLHSFILSAFTAYRVHES